MAAELASKEQNNNSEQGKPNKKNSKVEIIMGGLNCAHCAGVIEEKVNKSKSIDSANLNFVNKKLSFEVADGLDEEDAIEEVKKIINSTESGLNLRVVKSSQVRARKSYNRVGQNANGKGSEHGDGCGCGNGHGHGHGHEDENGYGYGYNGGYAHGEGCGCHAHNHGDDCRCAHEHNYEYEYYGDDTHDNSHGDGEKIPNKELIKLIIGALVYVFGIYQIATGAKGIISNVVFIIAYLMIGGDVLIKALRNATKGRMLDENFLMSIATVGALAIGEFSEAVGVMLFYKIGEYLQDMAVGKSRESITALMEIRADYANLKIGSEIKTVTPEDVEVGDIIVVKPGEKVPLDGVVIEGNSMLDTSAITGESVLREAGRGDEILSGVINKNALLIIRVTKPFGESTVSKILDMVENASSKKAPTENFISKFSRYYTPVVVAVAVLVAFAPPIFVPGADLRTWLYRGLIFLVVSCPCALVLSIPLTFFSGIGLASKNGILIKGSNYLEALRNVDTVVFDKTGTLTKGVFKVNKVETVGISEEKLLEYAAVAEVNSNHPIAKSIMSYYEKSVQDKEESASEKIFKIDLSSTSVVEEDANLLDIEKIEDYEEVAAHGIRVRYSGETILAGNKKLMDSEGIEYREAEEVGTVVYIAVDSEFKGYIVISDEIKDDSKEAIARLKDSGIKQVVMLTGDNKQVADYVADELKLDKVFSNLLPDEKVEKLEELYIGRSDKEKIAFVGDGINDAPVLARADVGIAMGGIGSDAAIEAADVVLMDDSLSKISKAVNIAHKTNKIVWQNIVFALSVKAIVMVLGAGGVANMWEAIFADVGVALIAVLNAMRAMR